MRRALAVIAALGVVLAMSACSGDPHPVPLSRAQRITLYERDSQRGWDQLAQLNPSTPRPDLSVKSVSSGGQWALDMASCLRRQGITQFSVTANGLIDLTQSPGFTSGITGIPQFVCQAQHPNTRTLDYYLSRSQLAVLYDYYVGFLEPCLVMHSGGKVGHIPSRARFIATYDTDGWSPYYDRQLSQVRVDSQGRYVPTALATACPPRPDWLPG